jgi:hypothetical protein
LVNPIPSGLCRPSHRTEEQKDRASVEKGFCCLSPYFALSVAVKADVAKGPRKTVRRAGTPAKVEQAHQAFSGRLSALKNPLQAEARESTSL